jgi:hypothetical protein
MGIDYAGDEARFSGNIAVDDAEALLLWLQENPEARLDLSACAVLHAACLQVLMASRATVAAWPDDARLGRWLRDALQSPAADA